LKDVETLTSEEEVALAIRIQQGDQEALSELVIRNEALVRHVAKRYVNRGLDFDDLISEGRMGLLRAARDFQPLRHASRFSTYATPAVYEAMQNALIRDVPLIHIPYWAQKLLRRLTKMGYDCRLTPTQEMADAIGIKLKKLNLVHQAACIEMADLENPLEEVVVSREEAEIESYTNLHASLESLDPVDAFILTLRFGLDDEPPLSLAEVGDYCGYSRERIRTRQRRALEVLKERLA
jgi:RNA polymerase primary sigma factor